MHEAVNALPLTACPLCGGTKWRLDHPGVLIATCLACGISRVPPEWARHAASGFNDASA